jgi:3'(2'), 5'-bisphosphate nucleotidase
VLSDRLIGDLTSLTVAAGDAILALEPRSVARRTKADASPVTAEAAEAVIFEGLARLLPGLPVVSEESSPGAPVRPLGPSFLLVDPLDGTREFLAGRDEYTVNLAVIAGGRPAFGIVAAPALGLIWRGLAGRGAERLVVERGADRAAGAATPIRTRRAPAEGLTALVSRSHLDARTGDYLARLQVAREASCGSSVKFCRIAEAAADVYPRLATTSEWDIAAGDAVLTAAGGLVAAPDGGAVTYGHAERGFRVPAFVAWGDATAAQSHMLGDQPR